MSTEDYLAELVERAAYLVDVASALADLADATDGAGNGLDPTAKRRLQLRVAHLRPAAATSLSSEIPVYNRPGCGVVKHRSDVQRAEPTGPHHSEAVHCFS